MPRSLGILPAFGFILLAASAHGGASPKQVSDSWTNPGTKWVYQTETEIYELLVTTAEQKGDTRVLHLEQSQDGKLTMSDNWGISSEGICRTSLTGIAGDPAAFLVKFSYKPGEKWTARADLKGDVTLTQSFTAREFEIVKVPAGTFHAIHVEFLTEATGERTVGAEYWFAPDAGIVKMRVQKGDGIVTHELKSFTPGKE
ncbi:MAG: DUF3108 domain-containing protein [Planctomycetes bacterium]|nr:DUF3108 domain-containing protein [Planctomycetota bacterium]